MTITEFLEARIREDEVEADIHAGAEYYVDGAWPAGLAARVLAECAAKRAVLKLSVNWDGYTRNVDLLRALAAVYASHPAYRSEWAL